ncbi:MAG: prephenate dehydratase [Erythrobacter sp.]
MRSFPGPALEIVDQLREAAAADPSRAIAFQGSPGANSHRAALEARPDMAPLPCFGFEDALEAVKDGRAGQAIIPIENSQHGRVADIHFLLPESGLSIVGEHFMPIHHALMGMSEGPFEAVYSHPQALGQSRRYLHQRGIVPLSFVDTAGAAAHVAELADPKIGAIAPAIAAELYGLRIVEEHVEDANDNMTRFVILADKPAFLTNEAANETGKQGMTTFIFEVKNVPAALYKVLGCFATNGVNMTKLESYQIGTSFAATRFYADIIGVPGDPAVDRALEECAFHSKELRVLGTYEQARKRG